ncbi:hypothetical protein CC78DRAFT_130704 [Lojkania enalia]|uniref:Uncharacterized protein n=1 Tax=Lojkania enalia TaxID=147567 RepID=A0A9P4NBU6_9PLEO|nr:hypothetical protein CC78DRAFT_130704 [Didymosphaeria enalia]
MCEVGCIDTDSHVAATVSHDLTMNFLDPNARHVGYDDHRNAMNPSTAPPCLPPTLSAIPILQTRCMTGDSPRMHMSTTSTISSCPVKPELRFITEQTDHLPPSVADDSNLQEITLDSRRRQDQPLFRRPKATSARLQVNPSGSVRLILS